MYFKYKYRLIIRRYALGRPSQRRSVGETTSIWTSFRHRISLNDKKLGLIEITSGIFNLIYNGKPMTSTSIQRTYSCGFINISLTTSVMKIFLFLSLQNSTLFLLSVESLYTDWRNRVNLKAIASYKNSSIVLSTDCVIVSVELFIKFV